MAYRYSSSNHNWELTLLASADLLGAGIKAGNDARLSFASLTGSMILAVAALESFLNSLGSLIQDRQFDWEQFERLSIRGKLESLCGRYQIAIDWGQGDFQVVAQAVDWRNHLAHSKPDFVMDKVIQAPKESKRYTDKTAYEFLVNEKNARRFYGGIVAVIEKLIKTSGIDPRAQCVYSPTE